MVGKNNGAAKSNWTLIQRKLLALFVILLFVNMPIVVALDISSVTSSDITGSDAVVTWNTDEEASSSIYYGTDISDLNLVESNSDTVSEHSLALSGLESETEYYYYVESETANDSASDDNSGDYYSFTTDVAEEAETAEEASETAETTGESSESEDTSSIGLIVEHEAYVGSDELDVAVTATDNTEIRVYVNGGYFSKDSVDAEESGTGTLTFRSVPLNEDQLNQITVEAVLGDLEETVTSDVYSDATHPTLSVNKINDYVEESSITISGSASELVSVSIKVNGEEVISGSEELSVDFSESVNLEEGSNTIIISATDAGGLTTTETVRVTSDTEDPTVDAVIEKGNEYYQNRAETDITGTTEAGAKVYLFVYRPQTHDYSPDFDDAWEKVEADENGEFRFSDIDFENEPISFDDLAPSQVPAGLEEVSISGVDTLNDADDYTFYIYIISEDASGKTGYYKDSVTVHSCYSQSLDFQITDVAKFQSPLRLDPTLMDDGREVISAVFTLDYRGTGSSEVDVSTGAVTESPFQIGSVTIEKACTQSMLEDEKFSLGCTLLGSKPTEMEPNSDGTAYYVTWNLGSSEDLSERDTDFWDDLKKRKIVFPLKVSVNYQEREATGGQTGSKTQTSCTDISYFVDVPVDSKEYIPDWLAEDGIKAINVTIEKIDKILPYLEKAILITSIGCVTSFLGKIVMRFARIASSNVEAISGAVKQKTGEKIYCPSSTEQWNMYLDSSIESWKDSIEDHDPSVESRIKDYDNSYIEDEDKHGKSLDDNCPSTANMWKLESGLEQAYKWTCDRVFCRAVPAKWTETKETYEIASVIQKQQQCSVSGACVPLREQENCRQFIQDNQKGLTLAQNVDADLDGLEIDGGTCWWKDDDVELIGNSFSTSLYYFDGSDEAGVVNEDNGVYKLKKIGRTLADPGTVSGDSILVYKEGDSYCSARDASCSKLCGSSQAGNFRAYEPRDGEGYTVNLKEGLATPGGSCFIETEDGLSSKKVGGDAPKGKQFAAGYTDDCFVDSVGDKYQCICEKDDDKDEGALKGARQAIATIEGEGDAGEIREKFLYRQDRVFKESSRLRGTYYPSERYYAGRDLAGAFGQDYLLDYLNSDGNKRHHEINPSTQHIGAFQSMCLSGIRGRLVLLRNVLDGLRQCITEAKYTGLQDAGMCKTIFTQHVCGLVYKAVSYFTDSCTPYGFSDNGKSGDILGEQIKATFASVEPAMQSSVDDLLADYDNAHLNEFFSGGAQGLTQSLCLAAFGYDFPLGADFIQDAAYSVAMKTMVLITPANREFTNYNPKDLTTVHNYEVAAVIFAGCRINNYNTYLKCIGTEDQGRPGIDTSCDGEGCDCLSIKTDTYASQRIRNLDGGTGYGVAAGEMVDIKLTSPQKIDSPYRYDHVVVEVDLDPNENPEKCFDEGYRTDTGGIFYMPINDITPPGLVSCQVESLTGRYTCPEIGELFYGDEGLAYLEAPYIECRDPSTGDFESCGTPNMLLLNNNDKDLVIKPYVYTDGAGYCMKIKVTGSGTDYGTEIVKIPVGQTGGMAPSIDIGEISDEMFGEYSNDLKLVSGSNVGCTQLGVTNSPSSVSSSSINFKYSIGARSDGSDGYKVTIPEDVTFVTTGYELSSSANRYLISTTSSETYLDLDEINDISFEYEGFEFHNILGKASAAGDKYCKYKVQVASSSINTRNEASIGVEVALLQMPEGGSCYSAKIPVTDNALGASSKKVTVVIQKESVAVASTSNLHSNFLAGDYEDVIDMASTLILEEPGTLSEAEGIYYYVMSLGALGVKGSGIDYYETEMVNLMKRFFFRVDTSSDLVTTFDDDVQSYAEFQNYRNYLCKIADELSVGSRNFVDVNNQKDVTYDSSTGKGTSMWGCI